MIVVKSDKRITVSPTVKQHIQWFYIWQQDQMSYRNDSKFLDR